jgi:hypothetical protein
MDVRVAALVFWLRMLWLWWLHIWKECDRWCPYCYETEDYDD